MKIYLTTCIVTGHEGPSTRYTMGPAESREAAVLKVTVDGVPVAAVYADRGGAFC